MRTLQAAPLVLLCLTSLLLGCTVNIPTEAAKYSCPSGKCDDAGSGADGGTPVDADQADAGQADADDEADTAQTADSGVPPCKVGAPGECDDGNPCTSDSCSKTLGCLHTNNIETCQDGDACTVGDKCGAGVCNSGPAPNCDDGSICTADSCNKATGCVNAPSIAACEDDDVCTKDGCETGTGCTHVANSEDCDDGDACTVADQCANSQCKGGAAPDCDDSEDCTTDGCNKSTGCTHTSTDADCDDGDACSIGDKCGGGACVPGKAKDCDDGKPCTVDSCDAAGNCLHTEKFSGCDDGNPCTVGETCAGGLCQGGLAKNCDDGNVCTADSCDPVAGCQFKDAPGACNDGDACTSDDACVQGTCKGSATVSVACCATVGGQVEGGHCLWTDKNGRKMTLVPPGPLWMGCNAAKDSACGAAEKPQHLVQLTAFWLDVYEVTAGDYKSCVAAGKCAAASTKFSTCNWNAAANLQHPINCVSWTQAQAYCLWAGAQLPTEAQWEKGARGGCEHNGGASGCQAGMRTFPWGEAPATCNFAVIMDGTGSGCGKSKSWPVGQKAAGISPYGAYDMAGGVLEWTRDGYSATWYSAFGPQSWPEDPWQITEVKERTLRGGSWATPGETVRSSGRMYFDPNDIYAYVGFRCVLAIP